MGLTKNLDEACHDARWRFSWTSKGLPANAYPVTHPRAKLLVKVVVASRERKARCSTDERGHSSSSKGLPANAFPMSHPRARLLVNVEAASREGLPDAPTTTATSLEHRRGIQRTPSRCPILERGLWWTAKCMLRAPATLHGYDMWLGWTSTYIECFKFVKTFHFTFDRNFELGTILASVVGHAPLTPPHHSPPFAGSVWYPHPHAPRAYNLYHSLPHAHRIYTIFFPPPIHFTILCRTPNIFNSLD